MYCYLCETKVIYFFLCFIVLSDLKEKIGIIVFFLLVLPVTFCALKYAAAQFH